MIMAAAGLMGCASLEATNKESLLTAAGRDMTIAGSG
jgi:hypothetical protein